MSWECPTKESFVNENVQHIRNVIMLHFFRVLLITLLNRFGQMLTFIRVILNMIALSLYIRS